MREVIPILENKLHFSCVKEAPPSDFYPLDARKLGPFRAEMNRAVSSISL